MKLKLFENFAKIDIDSDPIDDGSKHRNIDDAYCGYEKALKAFYCNNVTVEEAKGDVWGDDFKGLGADLEILLSNGLMITWKHEPTGKGEITATTKKGTQIFSEEFDLVDIAQGISEVLIIKLFKIIKFEF